MSSPVGHSLAGYFLYCFRVKSLSFKKDRLLFTLALLAANAPDLDFLPGLIVGKPNLYHHGISHSLGFALIVSLLLAWGVGCFKKYDFSKNWLFFLGAYCSHLVLDYFSIDSRPPIGIPLFWPLNRHYLISPHPILPPISHSQLTHATTSQLLTDACSMHNVYAIFLECSIMLPLFIIVFFILKKETVK